MSERIFIGTAWPYANGHLHLGHVAGCYLPADIFARYHRLKGNQVLMVSGSDQHGTPITIRAEQEGQTPQQVVDKYHRSFLDSWQRLGITFDLFTTTGTENHLRVVHDVFLTLYRQGLIYKATMMVPYCQKDSRYLPDRYVKGTCPHCGNPDSRGDQCERCSKPLNPEDLGGAVCRICGSSIQMRESEHLFLRLSAFQKRLLDWVRGQSHWKPNVLNFTTRFLEDGLKDRAISRDILWGVPVPVKGYERKRIYVWFEAVIGYLSASQEWAQKVGDVEAWREFWQGDTKGYYFIGKDNIPFHTIIWPAMLMGYSNLNLPYDVPANEFLALEGRQFSTSRNWAVWLPDFLDRYDPDPLRYHLTISMPETRDADFSWADFIRRNNNELVGTYGNLVHRTLTFTYRNFEQRVPEPGKLGARDNLLLQQGEKTLEQVDEHLHGCHFRDAMKAAMALAQEANRYLDEMAPWKSVNQDRVACATTLWVTLATISTIKTALYPFLPFSSEKLHQMMGFPGDIREQGWRAIRPVPGQRLNTPEPLYQKLEEKVAQLESSGLRAAEKV